MPSYSGSATMTGSCRATRTRSRPSRTSRRAASSRSSPATHRPRVGARPGLPAIAVAPPRSWCRPTRPASSSTRRSSRPCTPPAASRRARLRVRREGGARGVARRRRLLRVDARAGRPLHRDRHAVRGRDGARLRRREHRRPAVAVAREGARCGDRAQRADRRVRPPRDRLAHRRRRRGGAASAGSPTSTGTTRTRAATATRARPSRSTSATT